MLFVVLTSCNTRNSINTKDLQGEKFYWASASINGRKLDKAAMFVPININNLKEGLFAQFDLGSNVSLMYQKNLESIPEFNKLKLDSLPDGGIDDGKRVFVIHGVNISIGKINLGKRELYGYYNYGEEVKIEKQTPVDKKSIGTIGADFVQNKILVIDFINEKFNILDTLSSAIESDFNFIDCKIIDNRIMIPIDFNGKTRYFFYDTGASLFPMVTTKLIWDEISNTKLTDSLDGSNFGNPVKMLGSNSKNKVKIADEQMYNFIVYYEEKNYFDEMFEQIKCDGLIGNAFFLNKRICIDYKTKRFGISR